jgi:hypothetical protein
MRGHLNGRAGIPALSLPETPSYLR